MTLKQYLVIMLLATILCWVSFGVVVYNVDPFQDKGLGFSFFYFSIFFSFLGTISIISFLLRKTFSKLDLPIFRYVKQSFYDSFILSIAFVILLFLQSKKYLNWWNFIIFLVLLLLSFAYNNFRLNSKRTTL